MQDTSDIPLNLRDFILCILFLLPSMLPAQRLLLTGQLLSATTQAPVSYANVIVEETGEGTAASATGKFQLWVPSLPVTLRFYRIGYADTTIVAQGDDLGIIYLRSTVLSGEEVLISATRAVEGETPIAFTTLDRDEIDRFYSHRDVPMVLAGEPGVYAYSDAGNGVGYTYLKIRGFSQDRIGVYLNGVPLNDPEAHAVYWVDHGDLLAGVSDIQIQRGVGNSLYGTSVFGGTVNLASNFQTLSPGFTLTSGYGNYTDTDLDLPTRKLSFAYAGGPWRDQGWTLYGRFSDLASEGYRIGSGTSQRSLHAGIEKSNAASLTRVEGIWGDEQTAFSWEGIIPLYGYDLDDRENRRYNYYADPDWNGGLDDANKDVFIQSIVIMQHSRKIADGLLNLSLYRVKGDGYYEQFKGSEDIEEYNLAAFLPDTLDEIDLLRRKWLRNGYSGFVYHYTHPISQLCKVTIGGDARFYSSEHYGKVMDVFMVGVDVADDHRYYTDRSKKSSMSFYVHSVLTGRERLSAMLDLRYLGHRYTFEQDVMGAFTQGYAFKLKYDFFDAHFGFNVRVNEDVSLFLNLSTGHREPADGDIYDHDDPDIAPVVEKMDAEYATPLVREEALVDYEAGLRFSFSNLSGTVNLYCMDFRDELVPVYYRYTDADDVLQGNAPRTIHQGVELALTFVPISRLRVDGNLSLADNHFVEFRGDSLGWGGWGGIADYSDRVIPAFPSLQAKGNVIWTHSLGETWLQVVYAGKQYIDFANTESAAIDPYALVHAGTRLDLPRIGPVKPILAVSVNNLLDTLYETFGYTYYDGWPPYRVDAYWPGATRSYFFEVKFQF